MPPQNFYGVGGMKIFRDLIWIMQGMMKADYQFFKQHGQFDFPQKKKGTILGMYVVGAMLSSKKIKAKMGNKMTEGMLMPYKKTLEKVEQKIKQILSILQHKKLLLYKKINNKKVVLYKKNRRIVL